MCSRTVNVTSTAASFPSVGLAAYNASKAGLTMLTRTLALEWARDGVDGPIYIVQARPETVQSRAESGKLKSYHLREAGGGLALHHSVDGARVCKASELGHSYSKLMRRFREPFPGHAHSHLARRILGGVRPEKVGQIVPRHGVAGVQGKRHE